MAAHPGVGCREVSQGTAARERIGGGAVAEVRSDGLARADNEHLGGAVDLAMDKTGAVVGLVCDLVHLLPIQMSAFR
jgi:hypothetical protein